MYRTITALRDLRLERGHSFLASLVTPGGLVIDAGAHRCEFANAIAEKYNVSVLSLEPNLSLSPNRLHPQVVLLRAAIAAHDGEAVFAIDDNPEASRLVGRHPLGTVSGQIVQTRSLSSLLEEYQTAEVELLKLDIEGAEYDVLHKAPQEVLARFKQISVEFHPFNAREPSDRALINDVIDKMKWHGFEAVKCSFRGFGDVLFVNGRCHKNVGGFSFPVIRKLLEMRG